jgi:4,5-DOPA dioxygenase extradiol
VNDAHQEKMPALFVGHGSPMNAVEDSRFRRGWAEVAGRIPKPRAILAVSAHWETPDSVRVTSSTAPPTIHDFYGFPPELFAVRYPVPGDPSLARRVADLVADDATVDPDRGLDHGTWGVLVAMYPAADVPVVQLSLDTRRPPADHYERGRKLRPLRDEGVLLVGSGNIVHNLGLIDFGKPGGFAWADRFDGAVKARIRTGDHESLVRYDALDPEARRAVPTPEHYLPLLYVLGAKVDDDAVVFFNDETALGSISMTSVVVGGRPA